VINRLGEPALDQLLRDADCPQNYLHWDKFRHCPMPPNLSAQDAWALLKMQRFAVRQELPFKGVRGEAVSYFPTGGLLSALRRIDHHAELSEIGLPAIASPDADTYSVRAFFDEAYYSSRIEGANTTRRVAKEMLRAGRPAQTKSEQMIVNNYKALREIDRWAEQPLTPELLCHIQGLITAGAIEQDQDCGQFRQDDEVHVSDALTGEVVHVPPPFIELESRAQKICDFANHAGDEPFVHPVSRAILLHYQIAYDHPFGDGNGRTARWVFLWSLLRRPEYWWVRFLPISSVIEQERLSYYQAFQNAESDGLDATYLVRHQVRCIEREMANFAGFLKQRAELREKTRQSLRFKEELNVRQLALFDYAANHADARFTQQVHAAYHQVTLVTAGRDLNELVEMGLLEIEKKGKVKHYSPTSRMFG